MPTTPHVIIAGGGAAGFFAAIACAEANPMARVTLYESASRVLSKVRISGGGRCNVTHSCFEPKELVKRYPRGGRELLGAFYRWQPSDTMAWFEERGAALKTESDGRVFPTTDDSETIIGCLVQAAAALNVSVKTGTGVSRAERSAEQFTIHLAGEAVDTCDRLLLATGGGKGSVGIEIAESLGHQIEPLVPSLFTFHVADDRLRGLEGISVPSATAKISAFGLSASGPLLITHWGLSGPAILKVSAWGARELAACNYQFTLQLAWIGERTSDQVKAELETARKAHPSRRVSTGNSFGIPGRLWERLVAASGISPETLWSGASNASLQALTAQLCGAEFPVKGKSLNKEEFVTCGGVRLSEVDFKTMESKVCPELFLAGEVLDMDGLTGGFNLQAAWTTGRIAGLAMASAPKR